MKDNEEKQDDQGDEQIQDAEDNDAQFEKMQRRRQIFIVAFAHNNYQCP